MYAAMRPPTIEYPPPPPPHTHTLWCGPYISKVFNYRWFITKLSFGNWALPFSLPTPRSCCVEETFTSLWASSFILKWVLPVNSPHTFWTQRVPCMSFGSHLVRGHFGIHQVLYCRRANAHLISLRFPIKTCSVTHISWFICQRGH